VGSSCGERAAEEETSMGKKSLFCGIMALAFVLWVPVAHAFTCNIHVLAANLPTSSPSFNFLMAVHNYQTTTENFDLVAFLPNGTTRSIVITLPPDRLRLVGPADIPIVPGEFADVYICWRFGTAGLINQVEPGSVMLLAIGGAFTAIPHITFSR
jgi:hypothetical protein